MATPVGRPPKQNNGGNLPPLDQGKTRDKVATKMATLTQGRPGLNAQICAITQPEAAAMLAWANEIKIRAKRKAGEMLAGMEKIRALPAKAGKKTRSLPSTAFQSFPMPVSPKTSSRTGRRSQRCPVRLLGWDAVPVTVVDLAEIAHGEMAENFQRKDFLPSEAVAIRRMLEPVEKQAGLKRMSGAEEGATCHMLIAAKPRQDRRVHRRCGPHAGQGRREASCSLLSARFHVVG